MTLNLTILETIIAAALAKVAGKGAWTRAIEKAAEQLITNPYICEQDGGLLILSYSGETYHANGACQCKAYAHGRPCWHRCAAQLVKRYREAEAAPVVASAASVAVSWQALPMINEQDACAIRSTPPAQRNGLTFHQLPVLSV